MRPIRGPRSSQGLEVDDLASPLLLAPVRLCAAALLALAPAGLGLAQDAPIDLHNAQAGASGAPMPPAKPGKPSKDGKGAKDGKDPAAPALTVDEIVAKANDYFDEARVMTADFVQIGPDGARSEGQLYVARPGRMLFKFNPPERLEIVADGRSVAVRDQKLGTQDLYFIAQTPLKFLLADHIDLAKDTQASSASTSTRTPRRSRSRTRRLSAASPIFRWCSIPRRSR